jgi:hypothetical protein
VRNYLIEFYQRYKKPPKFDLWRFEDPFKVAFNKPPEQALKYLKQKAKKVQVSVNWNDLSKEAHSKSFTVAKVMSADVLQNVIDYIQKSVASGKGFKEFKQNAIDGGLVEAMQQAGWTGNANRLHVIFDTNVKMAQAKGRYQQLMLTKDVFPNVKYVQIERKTKRHDHSLLHNHVFSLNDPVLNRIYPPSGFRCGCTLFPTKENPTNPNLDFLKTSKDFNISPIEPWKPDVKKYTDKIQKTLKEFLDSQKPVEPVKPVNEPVNQFKFFDNKSDWLDDAQTYCDKVGIKHEYSFASKAKKNIKVPSLQTIIDTFLPANLQIQSKIKVQITRDGIDIDIDNVKVAITRKIYIKDKYVDHYFYKIFDEMDRGHISEIFFKQIELYKEYDIKEIQTHANIDVGGYAWSKYGFVFDNENSCRDFYDDLARANKSTQLLSEKDINKILVRARDTNYEVYDFIQEYRDKYDIDKLKHLITDNRIGWYGKFVITDEHVEQIKKRVGYPK